MTKKSILFFISFCMICILNAETIKYKNPYSLDETIILNAIILNSDSEFIYYKNNYSFNTNQIPCSQIIEITNASGNSVETSCLSKTNVVNPSKNNKIINKSIAGKSEAILLDTVSEKMPIKHFKGEKSYDNINLLLMGLIVFFIFFILKEK